MAKTFGVPDFVLEEVSESPEVESARRRKSDDDGLARAGAVRGHTLSDLCTPPRADGAWHHDDVAVSEDAEGLEAPREETREIA